MQQFDVAIVGGGLVGTGLALALRETGLKIALIDAKPSEARDARLYALNDLSCHFLKNIQLWPVLSTHATPIQQVHLSYQHHFGSVRLKQTDVGLPALGYVIPAQAIETAMSAVLSQWQMTQNNLTVFRPATVTHLATTVAGTQLTLHQVDQSLTIKATLVIGSDGTDSTIRQLLAIDSEIYDYQQSALVTITSLQRHHQYIAYERFQNQGAIAMLPLNDQQCATIWTGERSKIAALQQMAERDFIATLQKEFGYRLGRLAHIGQRHVYPLQLLRAKQMTAAHVLLLGNAAHTFHPIAAQGLNLALYEVATLVEVLQATPHASAIDLHTILEQSRRQQESSLNISHRLPQLFNGPSSLRASAIQLGFVGLDLLPVAKKILLQTLIGQTGRVPRLLLSTSE